MLFLNHKSKLIELPNPTQLKNIWVRVGHLYKIKGLVFDRPKFQVDLKNTLTRLNLD